MAQHHDFDEGIPGKRNSECRRCGQDARCTTLPCPTTFSDEAIVVAREAFARKP